MSFFKNRIICALVIISDSFIVWASQPCTAIDAVTSATLDMQVVSGSQACQTTASVKWTERHGDGSGYMEYGTSTSYGTKANISGGSGTITVAGLKAATTYYYHFFMSNGSETCNSLKGSFATTSTTALLTQAISAKGFALRFGNIFIQTPFDVNNSVSLTLFAINGAVVAQKIFSSTGAGAITVHAVKSGLYTVTLRCGSDMISQKIFIAN